MNRYFKHFLTILLAVLMVAAFGACSQTGSPAVTSAPAAQATASAAQTEQAPPTTANAEVQTFRYVTPDWYSNQPDMQMVLDAVNKKLVNDGLNIKLQWDGLSFDSWENKINLMITTNEAFDMFVMMNDIVPLDAYYSRGVLQPIGKYIDQYGQTLKQLIPESYWKSVTINGDIQCLPDNGYPNEVIYQDMACYSYIFKQNNIAIPTTNDEMLAAFEQLHKLTGKTAWVTSKVLDGGCAFLNRSYDTWPFAVYDDIFKVDQQGNVTSWIDSDEFKKDCKFMDQLMADGIISKDILTQTAAQMDQSKIFWDTTENYNLNNLKKTVPDATMDCIAMAPDKPFLDAFGATHAQCVPITSKHPEIGVRFFNWLYSDEANMDLLVYGIEGTHWKPTDQTLTAGSRTVNIIEPITKDVNGKQVYGYNNGGGFWMLGNLKYKKYYSTDSSAQLTFDTAPANIVTGVAVGFTFDPTPVATEYANVEAEVSASEWPLKYGVIGYDAGFQAMKDKFTAAGLDKVVAEYQKQLTAWLAKSK